MSRSAAAPALAYDLPATAPARTKTKHTQSVVKLLGGEAYASPSTRRSAAPQSRSQVSYLHLVTEPAWDAYAPPEREHRVGGLQVAHPAWLALAAVCLVAMAMVIVNGATHGRQARYGNRAPMPGYAALASAMSVDPEIDVTSQAQQAEAAAPAQLAPPPVGYDVTGAPSISVGQIEAVLQKYGSPAVGKGQALYDLGVRYGIDPAFALAFFVHESGCGTKGVARFTHSIGNIRWTPGFDSYEGYRSYSSWEAGMEDWYKLITDLYINGWGLRTVDAIIPVYAPSGDSNDPPSYIQSVKAMVDTWRGQ